MLSHSSLVDRYVDLVCLTRGILESPSFVDLRMQGQPFHEQRRNKTNTSNADHDLPDDNDTLRKRLPDLALQRLLQLADGGDGGVRERDALRELREEFCRQTFEQLVLQYCTANRDAPDLRLR